ncbi:hypothetical protein DPMN_057155 [Dreissena polymorpha]|uniref:Uncharacterized protein n=1 Tax=Dreissena polymorpha TaxID=45954 RepID=A0A9D4CT27_DREPO|nr:hypothetical protein DPMN_057155 [Dreissena polymorpha]
MRTISRGRGLGRRSRLAGLAGPRVPGLADHLSRPGSRKVVSASGTCGTPCPWPCGPSLAAGISEGGLGYLD